MTILKTQFVIDSVAAAAERSSYPVQSCNEFKEACLLVPLHEVINVSEFHAVNLGVAAGAQKVWLITRSDPQSVFFDDASGLFGTCWGPDRETGNYDDLGFRSPDPIEMFLV